MWKKTLAACLAFLLSSAADPHCACGETLAELAQERGELRFVLCTGPAGTLVDECAELDEETVWTLGASGEATLRAEGFSSEGRWQERRGAVGIVSQTDDTAEYHAPWLQAMVGMVDPQLVHYASPGLDRDAPSSFEDVLAWEKSRTFYACTGKEHATTAEECAETDRRHSFTFNRDGTGFYVKPTQREPVKFSWTWKPPVVEARIKTDIRGRFLKSRYLELESPWKGRRAFLHYRLLDGREGAAPAPAPKADLPPLVDRSSY